MESSGDDFAHHPEYAVPGGDGFAHSKFWADSPKILYLIWHAEINGGMIYFGFFRCQACVLKRLGKKSWGFWFTWTFWVLCLSFLPSVKPIYLGCSSISLSEWAPLSFCVLGTEFNGWGHGTAWVSFRSTQVESTLVLAFDLNVVVLQKKVIRCHQLHQWLLLLEALLEGLGKLDVSYHLQLILQFSSIVCPSSVAVII